MERFVIIVAPVKSLDSISLRKYIGEHLLRQINVVHKLTLLRIKISHFEWEIKQTMVQHH